MMIKAKEFTMSHLDRFNRIDVLSIKGLVTLLHIVRVKKRILIIETHSNSDQNNLEEIIHDSGGDVWDDELVVYQVIIYIF